MKKNIFPPAPSLIKLLFVQGIHRLRNPDLQVTQPELPSVVGEYQYTSEFQKVGTAQDFALGVYQNKKGQKAIGKMWSGDFKNFAYYSLQNEVKMYLLLNEAKERVNKNGKKTEAFKDCYIPQLLNWQETPTSLFLLLEFVEGTMANDLSTAKKLPAYWALTDYVSYLGTNLTTTEKKLIPSRSALSYCAMYPLLLCKACLTHTRAIPTLLKGVPVFIKSIPALFATKDVALIHRDLHFKNILISPKRMTLIDLQLCVQTIKLYEMVMTLRYRWKEDDLHQKLLVDVLERYKNQPNFETLFRGLAVFSATHGLTGSHFPKQKISYWIDFCRFATEDKLAPSPYLLKNKNQAYA